MDDADIHVAKKQKRELSLSTAEQELFSTLLSVVKHFNLDTTLRVAGGWVRDKLLGRETHDIDVALDHLLGREFADYLNRYLEENGQGKRQAHVIQANPEQSKHLETVKVKIGQHEVDFVNLRCETYSSNSRIPEMTQGLPSEDAYRRDLTINSLFYNINQATIEDYTAKGIADLEAGIIRTPLPPLTTFLDDPLRVLRAVRFASRFGFTVVDELREAAMDLEVKAALKTKISRERVGVEIDLMLNGRRPLMAMSLLLRFGLFDTVFSPPPSVVVDMDKMGAHAADILDRAARVAEARPIALTPEERRLLYLSALLSPYSSYTYLDKKRSVPASKYVVRESLRLKTKDADDVATIHTSASRFIELISALSPRDQSEQPGSTLQVPRKDLGLLLRSTEALWPVAMYLAAALQLSPAIAPTEPSLSSSSFDPSPLTEEDRLVLAQYNRLHRTIEYYGLVGVWNMKPLINGQEVMKLTKVAPGPRVGEIVAKEVEWMLENPLASTEQCKDWLLASFGKR